MTGKERVKKAIEFDKPDRVPIFMFNRDLEKSDIIITSYSYAADFCPKIAGACEWGWSLYSNDDTMGLLDKAPICEWSDLDEYNPPCGTRPERFCSVKKVVNENPEKFIIGNLGISGFTNFTFIRGFTNAMTDFYLEEENTHKLLDIIFNTEMDLICGLIDSGVDAISFYDDWGSQSGLFISNQMWIKYFYDRYQKQFEYIHRRGKKVFFHSCGNIFSIIPLLIQLKVDIINMNGLEVVGFERVKQFAGKVCFCCPVDLQSVAISANKQEIYDYTQKMIDQLGTHSGGFIGYVEEYHSIGLSDKNYWDCYYALLDRGKY